MSRFCYGCMSQVNSPVCEKCGFPENGNNEPHQLPVGTVLRGQYTVGKALGQGGFGITYIGWDNYLDMAVAIKEYYPNALVKRDCTQSLGVSCYTEQVGQQYHSSRERFLREAKALALFDNIPAVVKVKSFFPENNTAYIIMEYVKGVDLARYIQRRGGCLSREETFRILKPVMEALEAVHRTGMVHRDISPDNIVLHPLEGAKLLDFGAVKVVENADTEKALTRSTEAILKHGFAPLEQYQNRGGLGPWTDVYAMCATLYYCLTGCVPVSAVERVMGDADIDWQSIPELTQNQIAALRKGMALRARDRFSGMGELMQALFQQEQPSQAEIQQRARDAEGGRPVYAQPVPPKQPVSQTSRTTRSTEDILNQMESIRSQPSHISASVKKQEPFIKPVKKQDTSTRSTADILAQFE